jgi:hypothetical protein
VGIAFFCPQAGWGAEENRPIQRAISASSSVWNIATAMTAVTAALSGKLAVAITSATPTFRVAVVRPTAGRIPITRPPNPHDSAFCLLLAHSAVHAAMSGRTNMVVRFWNHQFIHVPISLAASKRKKIDPKGTLWNSVLASIGQPGKCIESTQVEERESSERSNPSLAFLTRAMRASWRRLLSPTAVSFLRQLLETVDSF